MVVLTSEALQGCKLAYLSSSCAVSLPMHINRCLIFHQFNRFHTETIWDVRGSKSLNWSPQDIHWIGCEGLERLDKTDKIDTFQGHSSAHLLSPGPSDMPFYFIKHFFALGLIGTWTKLGLWTSCNLRLHTKTGQENPRNTPSRPASPYLTLQDQTFAFKQVLSRRAGLLGQV